MSDDQKVSLGLRRGSLQRFIHIAAIDNYFGMGARILLKLGNFLRSETHDLLLPYRVDQRPSRAKSLNAGGDVNEREPRPKLRSHLRGLRHCGQAVRIQIYGAKNIVEGPLSLGASSMWAVTQTGQSQSCNTFVATEPSRKR